MVEVSSVDLCSVRSLLHGVMWEVCVCDLKVVRFTGFGDCLALKQLTVRHIYEQKPRGL